MIERRAVVGGAAVTEEFHPGFRNSTASYTVSLLNPKVIEDMRLYEHGLKVVLRKIDNFLPTIGPDYLLSGRGGLTRAEIARHSPADAEGYDAYSRSARIRSSRCSASGYCGRRPMPAAASPTSWPCSSSATACARSAAEEQRHLLDFFTKSAADILQRYFSNDLVQALFGFDVDRRPLCQPLDAGLGLCPAPPRVRRGGRRSRRLGPCDRRHGRDQRGDGAARRGPKASRSSSTRRSTRSSSSAARRSAFRPAARPCALRQIVANTHPKTIVRATDSRAAPSLPSSSAGCRTGQSESATFRMNVALSSCRDSPALPGARRPSHRRDHHGAVARLYGPGLYQRAHRGLGARADHRDADPLDPRRQPGAGRAAMSRACSASISPTRSKAAGIRGARKRPTISSPRSTATRRASPPRCSAGSLCRRSTSSAASASIGGDIFHGKIGLDQLFSARPMLGYADYRMPLPGLYLCGAGAHPGGGVTGAPGHNAAQAVLADRRSSGARPDPTPRGPDPQNQDLPPGA